MKKSRILFAIIGILLMISGIHDIYRSIHKESKPTTVSIGQSVSDKDGVSFCVTSVEDTSSLGENCTTDNNFVVLTVKIDNEGQDTYDVNSLRFKLILDGKEYEYYAESILWVENAMFMDTINPGISNEYKIVYETPFAHTEKDSKLKILDNAYSNKGVFINLN